MPNLAAHAAADYSAAESQKYHGPFVVLFVLFYSPMFVAMRFLLIPALLLAGAALPASSQQLRPVYSELGPLGEGGITIIAESPHGRFVLYGVRGQGGESVGEARIFDRESGRWFTIGRRDNDYAWSPQGDRIAFAKVDEQGEQMHIWTLPIDPGTSRPTGPPRRVSVGGGRAPVFSPDGRTIAFSAFGGADATAPRIVLIPAAAGPETVLVRDAGFAQRLRWSPDGRWVYYVFRGPADPPGVALMRVPAQGGEPQVLRRVQRFNGLSSDGRFLAYIPLDVAASQGQVVVGISTAEGIEIGRFTLPRYMDPSDWSASGWKLLAHLPEASGAIHTLPVRGGSVRTLATGSGWHRSPSWSPDGTWITYTALLGDRFQLMLVNASGGPRRQVATRAEPDDYPPPLWSPDGRFIAFLASTPAERALHVVEIGSGAESQLVRAEGIEAVVWRRDSGGLLYARTVGERQEIREVTLGGRDTPLRALNGELSGGSLSFVGDSAVVVASAAGVFTASLRQDHQRKLYEPVADEVEPRWFGWAAGVSRNGRWTAIPITLRAGTGSQDAIRLIPLDASSGRVVPIGSLSFVSPFFWHPDGQHLIVVGNRHAEERMQVMLVPLNGEPLRPLTASDKNGQFASLPVVSPDGSTIAYSVQTSVSATLWEIDLTRALAPYAAQRTQPETTPRALR